MDTAHLYDEHMNFYKNENTKPCIYQRKNTAQYKMVIS